jgi:hypothetical protein
MFPNALVYSRENANHGIVAGPLESEVEDTSKKDNEQHSNQFIT